MSVYVDTERNRFGRMVMSHMWADTAAELHEMAATLGLKRKWYQTPDGPHGCRASFPHYDVSQSVRAKALERGAIELARREAVDSRRSIRAHMIDDTEFAMSWRYAA